MALHGHTILELRDVKTGAVQVVEKDNMVTGAVAEIFKPFGLYTSSDGLFLGTGNGLKDYISCLFGGLVLYDTALGSDPNTFFPPVAAHVTGCAGYNMSNDGSDPKRGNCNLVESDLDLTHGTAKFVYEFGTAQGNGTIASVCLSHKNAGRFCAEREVSGQSQNEVLSLSGADCMNTSLSERILYPMRYKDNLSRLLALDEENDCALQAVYMNSSTAPYLTLNRYALLLREVSLFWARNGELPPLKSQLKVDLTGLIRNITYYALNYDPAVRKIYMLSPPPATTSTKVNDYDTVLEIDPDTGEIKQYKIANQTGVELDVYSLKYCSSGLMGCVYDGILYRKSYTRGESGLYRYFAIPLADPGSVQEITTNGNDMTTVHYSCNGRIYGTGSYSALVLNTADNSVYSVPAKYNYYPDSLALLPVHGRSAVYVSNGGDATSNYASITGGRLALRPNYLATINDLASPVVKTADKTMKITYILREGS